MTTEDRIHAALDAAILRRRRSTRDRPLHALRYVRASA